MTKKLKEPQATNGSRIIIEVSHLPAPEHDPVICPSNEVTHTHLYYDFLGASNDPILLDERPPLSACGSWEPRCGEPHPDPVVGFEWFEKMKEKWSGTAFNCMLAQAQPG